MQPDGDEQHARVLEAWIPVSKAITSTALGTLQQAHSWRRLAVASSGWSFTAEALVPFGEAQKSAGCSDHFNNLVSDGRGLSITKLTMVALAIE